MCMLLSVSQPQLCTYCIPSLHAAGLRSITSSADQLYTGDVVNSLVLVTCCNSLRFFLQTVPSSEKSGGWDRTCPHRTWAKNTGGPYSTIMNLWNVVTSSDCRMCSSTEFLFLHSAPTCALDIMSSTLTLKEPVTVQQQCAPRGLAACCQPGEAPGPFSPLSCHVIIYMSFFSIFLIYYYYYLWYS